MSAHVKPDTGGYSSLLPSLEIPDSPPCQDSSQLYLHPGSARQPCVLRCDSLWTLRSSTGFLLPYSPVILNLEVIFKM